MVATFQLADAGESVRVPQPSNTQPGDASRRNDLASRPFSHGLGHPASVRQVTPASALAFPQRKADILLLNLLVLTRYIPITLVPHSPSPMDYGVQAHASKYPTSTPDREQ